jgi:hypothetical protein
MPWKRDRKVSDGETKAKESEKGDREKEEQEESIPPDLHALEGG